MMWLFEPDVHTRTKRAEKQKSEHLFFRVYSKFCFAPNMEEQKGSKEVAFEPDVHTITERAEKTEEAKHLFFRVYFKIWFAPSIEDQRVLKRWHGIRDVAV
ncbi:MULTISPECIES: hypothetical protein [Paenibacillus]|uniref:hypothetical protein n=1 Tax=Paenibacillus TaxID=44249 RepID=UPI001059E6BD|nr:MULTISPECIES: hypothetical protein [Paenibacillus]TDL69989.1 hypothetical protein E2R58_12745 [Paenibacillus amylolyticus]WJM06488.1 hypothetical protein QNO02_19695 [Paenibacillus sp. PK1-4R]